MAHAAIRVGDVDLYAGTAEADLGLSRFFESARGTPMATLEILCAPKAGGDDAVGPIFQDRTLHIVIEDVERDLFEIFRHIGYLAGVWSPCYAFVHAAGLLLQGKGVLLLGRSGHGKSTLAARLGGTVIDDDMLLVDETEMVRVSQYGAHIKADGRTVRLAEDEHERAPVDCIFLLDRNAEPGRVDPIQASTIQPRETFDDHLHPRLFARYEAKSALALRAPAFRIGTRRAPAESQRMIEYVLEHL